MSEDDNIKEVLELAHGTYSMRDELANRFLTLQEELNRRQEAKPLTVERDKEMCVAAFQEFIDADDRTEEGKFADGFSKAYHNIKSQIFYFRAGWNRKTAIPPAQSARTPSREDIIKVLMDSWNRDSLVGDLIEHQADAIMALWGKV